jgi:hypothetical protein
LLEDKISNSYIKEVHRVALFKIFKGNKKALPDKITEGYMYVTEDLGEIYVDLVNNKRI